MSIASSAYPQQKSPILHSNVHQLLRRHLQEYQTPESSIRQYRKEDNSELRKLQREWFPLNYSDDFYNRIQSGSAVCFVAEAIVRVGKDSEDHTAIVGAIVFELGVQEEDLQVGWLQSLLSLQYNSAYIMTLGVVDEMRSTGLAKRLLDYTIAFLGTRPQIKIIALHVVHYNNRAIRFYKKQGFSMLDYLNEHYHIMGKQYDGLKLGLFLNGGLRREKWKPWVKRVFLRMEVHDQWPA